MKFIVKLNLDLKIKLVWSVLALLYFAWLSLDGGLYNSRRFSLGYPERDYKYYVCGLFILVALFIIIFALTRYVILNDNEIKVKISVAGYSIKIADITSVRVEGNKINITYNDSDLTEEVCLRPRDYNLFLQKFYAIAPHLKC